jgi:hypothetical protein
MNREGSDLMNKAVIMKITKNYAIILTDDGNYQRIILKDHMSVGQKILFVKEDLLEKQAKKPITNKIVAISVVAVMLIAMFVGFDFNVPATFALISIDINPSLDIKIDENQNVLEIIPLNNEAEDITDKQMIGQNVFIIIDEIITNAEYRNYLTDENNHILISSADLDNDSDHTLAELITSHLENDLKINTNIKVIYIESDKETAKDSIDKGISLGRLELSKITKDEKTKTESVTEIVKNEAIIEQVHILDDKEDLEELLKNIERLKALETPSQPVLDFLALVEDLNGKDWETLAKISDDLLDNDIIDTIKKFVTQLDEAYILDDEAISFLDLLVRDYDSLEHQQLVQLKNEAIRHWNRVKHLNKEITDLIKQLEKFSGDADVDKYLEDYNNKSSHADDKSLLEVGKGILDRLQSNKDNQGKNEIAHILQKLRQLDKMNSDFPNVKLDTDMTTFIESSYRLHEQENPDIEGPNVKLDTDMTTFIESSYRLLEQENPDIEGLEKKIDDYLELYETHDTNNKGKGNNSGNGKNQDISDEDIDAVEESDDDDDDSNDNDNDNNDENNDNENDNNDDSNSKGKGKGSNN